MSAAAPVVPGCPGSGRASSQRFDGNDAEIFLGRVNEAAGCRDGFGILGVRGIAKAVGAKFNCRSGGSHELVVCWTVAKHD